LVEKRPEVVRLLLEHKADVQARTKLIPVDEPYYIACTVEDPCANGATDGFSYPPSVHFAKFTGGFTPLMFAAQKGDVESARLLLAAGADVNESTVEDGSALVVASASGHEKFALFLLEKGADPNAKDGFGITPLHYALHEGLLTIADGIERGGYKSGGSAWERPNMPELMKALVAHGANPNVRIAADFPPYHYMPIARNRGTGLPQISLVGATPYLLAAASADTAAMRFLVEGKADPRLTTTEGVTPLMVVAGVACERGVRTEEQWKNALDAAKLVLELGGDVNAVGPGGRTALKGATFLGRTEMVQFLAEKGANLEAKDKYGETAMSIAAGDPGGFVFRQLKGAKYDFTFRTPPPRADKKMVELLLKLGAKPYDGPVRDRSGE